MHHLQAIKAQTAAAEYFQPSPCTTQMVLLLPASWLPWLSWEGPRIDLTLPVSTFELHPPGWTAHDQDHFPDLTPFSNFECSCSKFHIVKRCFWGLQQLWDQCWVLGLLRGTSDLLNICQKKDYFLRECLSNTTKVTPMNPSGSEVAMDSRHS